MASTLENTKAIDSREERALFKDFSHVSTLTVVDGRVQVSDFAAHHGSPLVLFIHTLERKFPTSQCFCLY